MKVPFAPNNNQTNSKQVLNSSTAAAARSAALPPIPSTNTAASFAYEPKSVLELRGSPSPVAQKPTSNNIITAAADILADPLRLEDPAVNDDPQLEDWDSFMRELVVDDDSSPVSKSFPQLNSQPEITQNLYSNLPDFPPVNSFDSNQFVAADFGLLSDFSLCHNSDAISSFEDLPGDLNSSNWDVGYDCVGELIRLAECFDTGSLQLGHVILSRLNQRLRSPTGKPLLRAAFYFKEALQSLLTGSIRPARPAKSYEIIQTIEAQKTFSSTSPIPMFSSFTANQAVLEALDGSVHVHIVDFDIGLGSHWASFMKDLADKANLRKSAPPVLRISALVQEEYAAESRLIRENLSQFAREMNISFDIDFVAIRNFEYLSFKAIKFMEGEKLAVVLSPAIFRHVGMGFLNDLRRISPHVVVHVDIEGQMGSGAASCRLAVSDGLEFYSMLLESLEAVNFNVAGGGDWMRRIETFVLYPKILEGVGGVAGRRGTAWREALLATGLRPVALSQFADFQAEFLLRRSQVRGFQGVRRQAEMLLCWQERPLVATSAWRFI